MASRVTLADHRTRHYYLVSICRRLLCTGLTADEIRGVFMTDADMLERWLSLRHIPPAYVVPLGAGAYRIAPPRFAWYDRLLFWCQVKLPNLLAPSIGRRPIG